MNALAEILGLVTLILGAVGATMIGRTLLSSSWSDDERTALALGLAFMLVAGPAYAFLLRFARSRLRDDAGERTSLAWAAYLNTALASSLIVSTVTAHNFLAGVFCASAAAAASECAATATRDAPHPHHPARR